MRDQQNSDSHGFNSSIIKDKEIEFTKEFQPGTVAF